MNAWHAIAVDATLVEDGFPVVIEISQGDKNKYEIDKETGLLRLDRVLHGAVHYPANYGFIPRTLAEDGDALDVLVLGREPVHPLTVLEGRAIGVMRMRDEKGVDDKLIAVCLGDPSVSGFRHHRELPDFTLQEIRKFFEEYKTLERKEVMVRNLEGPKRALEILRESLERYDREVAAER